MPSSPTRDTALIPHRLLPAPALCSNSAFSAIAPPLVDWLTYNRTFNKDALVKVLTYHTLGTVVQAAAVSNTTGTTLSSLCTTCTPVLLALRDAGNGVTIRTAVGNPAIATVTSADNAANNGVLHVINSVLVPGGVLPANDVVAAAANTSELTTLYSLLVATGLNNTLSLGGSANSYTVFAPTNTALAAVPAYIANNKALLTQVLTYHVKLGRIYADDLPSGTPAVVPTLNGQTLSVLRNGATVTITGNASSATVKVADVDTSNAVVHIIDNVLIPAGVIKPNLLTTASNLGLSTLVSLLNASGLTGTFINPGALTLFGPT